MAARVRRRAAPMALLLPLLWTGSSACMVQHGDPRPQTLSAPPSHARSQAPSPHAPAHGQRHRHRYDRVELVYDARLDLHAVAGRDGVYWDGLRYLRWADGAWQASVRIDGVWVGVKRDEVPARLVFWHERGYGGAIRPLPASPAP